MTSHEIEVIDASETDDFWQRYVLARKPVIIRGVFAGDPIAGAATIDGAKELIGSMPVLIQDEYTRQMDRSEEAAHLKREPKLAPLREYLDGHRDVEMSRRVITEFEVPPTLLSVFSLPDFCRPSTPYHDLFLHLFVAGAKNWAHVHFDMDQRHVLLVQIFGTKRVTLLPPSSSRWLHPFGNFGSISLEAMNPRERLAFLEASGGVHGEIGPMDAVYIPPLLWHYLDYDDLAGSFNIRFGRNPYNRFLSIENFLGDQYVQAVAQPFVSVPPGERPTGELAATLEEVVAAFNRDYDSRMDKYHAMNRTFRDIFRRNGLEEVLPLYMFDLDHEAEREAELRMRNNFLYRPGARTSWEAIEAIEPPAPQGQLRALEQKLNALGYTPELIDRTLANKFGRASLSELSRGEGSRFLAYLNSPSGAIRVAEPV